MENIIIYHTGSGNSLWIAKEIAQQLKGDTNLIAAANFKMGNIDNNVKTIGFVFPVLMWGVPPVISKCIEKMDISRSVYIYGIASKGSQLGTTLSVLQSQLKNKDFHLSFGFQLLMPFNCISISGPGSKSSQTKKIQKVKSKIASISKLINMRQESAIQRGFFITNLIFSKLNRMALPHISEMDKDFSVDDDCISCGNCIKICNNNNIDFVSNKPSWNHNCNMCFACLQWCQQRAIQYGKKTKNRSRYQHPYINKKELYHHKEQI